MILRQFLHTDPVIAASYIVGCGGKSAGVVIDPVEESPPKWPWGVVEMIVPTSAETGGA